MSYFTFDHKKVFYTETGTGSPLLLLHGNTASSNMFYSFADRYADHFRVILIDFLGHGQSDRLERFPADLWFYEGQQVIAFLKEKGYEHANLIGTSGGALAAINAGLEAPELIDKVIADSFEGEVPLPSFTETIVEEREKDKLSEETRMFYYYMHADDWETVVDLDTDAIVRHSKEIGRFFHKELSTWKPDLLLTGSREDAFISALGSDYFEKIYGAILKKTNRGELYLFDHGGHPALLSNPEMFYEISMKFLKADKS